MASARELDALMGNAHLTCLGTAFAGRVAASIVMAAGLPEITKVMPTLTHEGLRLVWFAQQK